MSPCSESDKEDSSYRRQAQYQQIIKCFTPVVAVLCHVFHDKDISQTTVSKLVMYNISLRVFLPMAKAQKTEKTGYREFFCA